MSADLFLKEALAECELHIKRIRFAMSKLNDHIPFTVVTWTTLNDETVEAMDQLIFRFIKLQDAMGMRVFPRLLDYLNEPMENTSMLDKLNRLEKLGYLSRKEVWQELRNLRNNLTHEYPDQVEDNCRLFNYFYSQVDVLMDLFFHVQGKISLI
ncbi:MAG: hypothetical protein EH225_04915 [Calditrichaeota bacterium]|nr:MAG: hypothetical protein EH225_04915 [Calditrichota bacterium]